VNGRCNDLFEVTVRSGRTAAFTLVEGRDFAVDVLALSDSLGLPLRPLELDLVRIGAAVYAADRRVRRPALTPDRYPGRDVALTFTVSDVGFWREQRQHLVEVLEFLSDDQVDVRFRQGPRSRSWESLGYLYPHQCESVSLVSGGLDSGAGLVSYLGEGGRPTLTVTVIHQSSQGCRAREQIDALPAGLRGRVVSTFTRTSLVQPPRMDRQEWTQRLRGFLFTAVAGVAAARLDLPTVNVFENGVGAVNFPAMNSMSSGGLAARGAHPGFLRRMGRLVTAVAGRPIEFRLPFKSMTKGEVVSRAVSLGGAGVLARSNSCVHCPPARPGSYSHCGTCPGCIEHLLAMHTASCTATRSTFKTDPRRLSLDDDDADGFRMLRCQIHDLQRMGRSGASASFRRHLEHSGALTSVDTVETWLDLYLRYADQAQRWVDEMGDVSRQSRADAAEAVPVIC
jgi:7-cyano-7-deazaguanine synthase in queuosine biosynthesis